MLDGKQGREKTTGYPVLWVDKLARAGGRRESVGRRRCTNADARPFFAALRAPSTLGPRQRGSLRVPGRGRGDGFRSDRHT